MALVFSDQTDNINCGSAADVDDLTALSGLVWVYPTAFTNERVIFSKGRTTSSEGWRLSVFGTGGRWYFVNERATTDANKTITAGSTGLLVTSAWQCLAFSYERDVSLNIYYGDTATMLFAPSAYSTDTLGSGTYNGDASRTMYIGNMDQTTVNQAIQAHIGRVMLWNRALTLAELSAHQFRPDARSSGLLRWFEVGVNASGGTVFDWAGSGQDGTPSGLTQGDHIIGAAGRWRRHGLIKSLPAISVGGGSSSILFRRQVRGARGPMIRVV